MLNIIEIEKLLKEIHECYKIAKKIHNSCCTTRSQLLYFALKNKGYKPKLIRYFTSKDPEKRKEFALLSGEKYTSHVVVLLDDKILDSNLDRIISKNEYEKRLNETNKGLRIFSEPYGPDKSKPRKEDLLRICKECRLSSDFTNAIKNLNN